MDNDERFPENNAPPETEVPRTPADMPAPEPKPDSDGAEVLQSPQPPAYTPPQPPAYTPPQPPAYTPPQPPAYTAPQPPAYAAPQQTRPDPFNQPAPFAPPRQNPMYPPAQPGAPYPPPQQNPYGSAPFTGNTPIYGQPAMPQEPPGKGMGIAGLVLGICSLIFGCLYFGAIPGTIGIILSALGMSAAKKVNQKNNMALAGLILSIIGTVLCIVFYIAIIVAAVLGYDTSSYNYEDWL